LAFSVNSGSCLYSVLLYSPANATGLVMRLFPVLLSLICLVLPGNRLMASGQAFVENKGQWEQAFAYRLNLKTAQVFFYPNKLLIDTWHPDDYAQALEHAHSSNKQLPTRVIRRHAYQVEFLQANAQTKVFGTHASAQIYNYFIGNEPGRWKSDVLAFGQIHYPSIWQGINLIYSIQNGRLKYDFQVQAGARVSDIRLSYSGLDGMYIKDGRLYLVTQCGTVREMQPIAWQFEGSQKKFLVCNYRLHKGVLTFEMGAGYNPQLPLTIDPEIIFSTYSGSTGDNWAATATYDEAGNAYLGGINFAPGYPVSVGAYQTNYVGNADITVSKFNRLGNQALYSTYIGGNMTEIAYSMVVDRDNNLIITGSTGSANFPITAGVAGTAFKGGTPASFWQTGPSTFLANYPYGSDFFIAKLSPNGNNLLASTFLGGSSNDGLNLSPELNHNYGDIFRGEVLCDAENNIYLIGTSRSKDLPVVNAWQNTHGGGTQDACLFKLNSQLSTILFASYFGGEGNDSGYGMAFDENGQLYFCGGSSSSTLGGTPGLIAGNSGGTDSYVARIPIAGGNAIRYTFLGTAAYDQCYFVQVDNAGDVVVLGQTSGNYPIQQNGNAPLYSVPDGSLFFHKLNSTLSQTIWSTRFGTSGQTNHLVPTAFMVDYCNFISFSIWAGEANAPLHSTTSGLPVSSDAFQPNTTGADFYLGVLKDNASGLHYGTFFGGVQAKEHVDGGTSRFDKKGIIYQAICAGCGPEADDMPVTPGVWSLTNNSSNCNAAIFKFDLSEYSALIGEVNPQARCSGQEIQFKSLSTGEPSLLWDFGDGSSSTLANPRHIYPDTGTYRVRLVARADGSCKLADTAEIFLKVSGVPALSASPTLPACKGDSVRLQLQGASSYLWLPNEGMPQEQTGLQNPAVSPSQSTVYTAIGSNECGTDTLQVPVEIYPFDILLSTADSLICVGDTVLIQASEAQSYSWMPAPLFTQNTESQAFFKPETSEVMVVHAMNDKGCKDSDSILIQVMYPPSPFLLRDTSICFGSSITLSGSNGDLDNWYENRQFIGKGIQQIIPAQTQTYVVSAENECGSLSDSLLVIVHRVRAGSGPETTVCVGDTIGVFASGGTNYAWSPPGDFEHPQASSTLLFPRSGQVYTVLVSDDNGCSDRDTLGVHTFALSQVHAGEDQFITFGDWVLLTGSGDQGHYSWHSDQWIACDTCLATKSRTDSTSRYILTLLDPNGCSYHDTLWVQVEGVLYLPNTFTPNNDGINDIFASFSVDVISYHLQIYNRWGELLYTTQNPIEGWDGTVKGQPAQSDVYAYKLRYTLNSGKESLRYGKVLLIP